MRACDPKATGNQFIRNAGGRTHIDGEFLGRVWGVAGGRDALGDVSEGDAGDVHRVREGHRQVALLAGEGPAVARVQLRLALRNKRRRVKAARREGPLPPPPPLTSMTTRGRTACRKSHSRPRMEMLDVFTLYAGDVAPHSTLAPDDKAKQAPLRLHQAFAQAGPRGASLARRRAGFSRVCRIGSLHATYAFVTCLSYLSYICPSASFVGLDSALVRSDQDQLTGC